MPLNSARTTTSSAAGAGSGSPRSSPRPGSATQNARASAVTRDTITFHPAQMISSHWQLPAAPLRASAVATVVAGFAGAIAIAELARGVLPVGGIYAVKAGAIFSIVMIVALGFLPRHHPFARFGPANQITTMRAMLVALVAALIGEPRFPNVATGAAAASRRRRRARRRRRLAGAAAPDRQRVRRAVRHGNRRAADPRRWRSWRGSSKRRARG